MTCEEARLLIAEELGGIRPASAELEEHLTACAVCQTEATAVRRTWHQMGELPEPHPSPWLATRFYAALDAYQQGTQEKQSRWFRFWPSKPLWQIAISCGCLAAGLFVGTMLTHTTPKLPSDDVTALRREMAGMRQLVTLSLLQQQSATDRLRGVTWSYRAEPNDMEVLSALLETVNGDPSVDVRLAAVDALGNFHDSSVARRGLLNALTKQDSPLVQIAIIDALTELGESTAAKTLQKLLTEQNVDVNVRKRAGEALKTFQ
jgi:hypothetical protein